MNGCPQSVVDGFKLIVEELQGLRRWFDDCPLGKLENDRDPLAMAFEWIESGMQGISDWSDEHEESGCSQDQVQEMIYEADYISSNDYDPDYWVSRDEVEEQIVTAMDDVDVDTLKEEFSELERTVEGLEIEAAKVKPAGPHDKSDLINLLVEALQGLAAPKPVATKGNWLNPKVAAEIRYELTGSQFDPATGQPSLAEVDQVPEVHGPLLAPTPEIDSE